MQQSIGKEISCEGIGLHAGVNARLTFRPAGIDQGIVFLRDGIEVPANFYNVIDVKRGTTLAKGKTQIQTVEHVLAALYGMEIDNVLIEVSGLEIPALDGSALPYVQLLKEAGIVPQPGGEDRQIEIKEPIKVAQGEVSVEVLPHPKFKATFTIDYPETFIGKQKLTFGKNFESEIAPARTYGFAKEVETLRKNNLALGGTLDNAVVIGENEYLGPLRFKDELVRHKILDLMGDMALLGCRLKGHVIAIKSGHKTNLEFCKEVAKRCLT